MINYPQTAESVNRSQTGHIEIPVEPSALELIREKLKLIQSGERIAGHNQVFKAIRDIMGDKQGSALITKIKQRMAKS